MTGTENKFRLGTAEQVEENQLDLFMRGYFSEEKCNFLLKHGLWRHKSNKHRMLVLTDDDQIAGYCSAIPAEIWIEDHKEPAFFWIDNYVPPEWRGKRIQSLTDQAIRQMPELQLGFPNEFVVPIHRKHGWDVREDYSVLLMPLVPTKVLKMHGLSGIKKFAFLFIACMSAPVIWLNRFRLKRYHPLFAKIIDDPDPEYLSTIFRRFRDGWITTNRSAEYINWRFIDSPFHDQYTFFIGGSSQTPSLVAVCRTFTRRGVKMTRILDIFGDLADKKGLKDLLRFIAREAIIRGACQVTALATEPSLKSFLKSNGFILSVISRFRCHSINKYLMKTVREKRCHWVLADSDNDSIDQ